MTEWKSRIVGHGEEAPDQLLANPQNWRIHPKEQQDALSGILGEVGWVQSVIVNRTTGHLVDGHLRVSIALRDGATKVPVVYVDLTPEEEALVLATIDPIAGLAVTDSKILDELLADVSSTSAEVQKLLDDLSATAKARIARDAADTPDEEAAKEPIAKTGDVWIVGSHRIACGDAYDPATIDRLLAGKNPDCVLTDPPYGINLDTDYSGIKGSLVGIPLYGGGRKYRKVEGDDKPFDAAPIRARFASVKEQFWFGANYYRRTLSDSDLDGSWLVWDKRITESSDKMIGSGFELLWSATPHKQDLLRFYFAGAFGVEARDRFHPTQKPTPMLTEIILRWTKPGAIVIDTFAGSGSTLVAAAKAGRIGYGVEIDPLYVDVIVRRLEKATGETARREE
jgi:DNA modification methylase